MRWPATANGAWPRAWTATSPSRFASPTCFPTIAAVVAGEAPPDEGPTSIVDEQKLLAHAFAGNAALLADVIDAFATETPLALATMREAVEAGDLATLARAAHKMKGTVGVFTTGPALSAAGNWKRPQKPATPTAHERHSRCSRKGSGSWLEKLREMRARST